MMCSWDDQCHVLIHDHRCFCCLVLKCVCLGTSLYETGQTEAATQLLNQMEQSHALVVISPTSLCSWSVIENINHASVHTCMLSVSKQ